MKKGRERNSPNFAPPLILEKIRRNFTTKLRLLVLYKLSWNVVFSHRRKLRVWIFRSAYALQYNYSRNVWLKKRFEAVCAVSLFLKDCVCPLKPDYRFSVSQSRDKGCWLRYLWYIFPIPWIKRRYAVTYFNYLVSWVHQPLSWERSVHCDVIRPRIVWIQCLCVKWPEKRLPFKCWPIAVQTIEA